VLGHTIVLEDARFGVPKLDLRLVFASRSAGRALHERLYRFHKSCTISSIGNTESS
jgi:hypothetical protein